MMDTHPEKYKSAAIQHAPERFANTRYERLRFDRASVLQSAPRESGVYGLFSALWIYIGEAQDLQSRLLEHLAESDSCIAHYQPSSFAYELLDADKRLVRQAELFTKLQPLYRGRDFVYRPDR